MFETSTLPKVKYIKNLKPLFKDIARLSQFDRTFLVPLFYVVSFKRFSNGYTANGKNR